MPETTTDASAVAEPSAVVGGHLRAAGRSIDTSGRTLRAHAARGVLVNAGFDVGLSVLALVQGFVLAALLTRSDFGVWGILVVSLGVLAQLKAVGVGDKYLQQDEADQALAFQKAFTLELIVTGAALVPLAAALPVIALVYGHWELVAPGAVLLSVLVADALQAPLWISYRAMDFTRQRTLAAVEPLTTCLVTVVLALAGLGYWALALGLVAGSWTAAFAALLSCPFPLRWRYDRGAARAYATFSWPIAVATGATAALANGMMIASNAHLGLAGAGAVALASKISEFTTRLDSLVSGTLYPAICAIQGRLDLLRETFVKSNRLALLWAMPFGIGLALFAGDLVRFAIGERWRAAVGLLQIMGLVAAVNHVGFNWDGYFRARAHTRPIAISAVASSAVMLAVGIPLLLADGLTGLGIGLAAGAVVQLALRALYVGRAFEGFTFGVHAARALVPALVAGTVVLTERACESGPRSGALAAVELVSFVIVAAAASWICEGGLLRESVGYVRSGRR